MTFRDPIRVKHAGRQAGTRAARPQNRRFRSGAALVRAALFAGAMLAAPAAAAESCYPQKAPANLIGRYFVYEAVNAAGYRRLHTTVIAGRSEEGGLITCFYHGRPGALGELQNILGTDATYSFAWSLDPANGQRTVASDQDRACDLGGLGRCATRRDSSRPNRPTVVQEFDRRCEDGDFVKITLSMRAEGGDPRIRALWNKQMAREPRRRHEIRYRADGAILRSVMQFGEVRAAPNVLIEEGDWTGPSCLPGVTS